MVSIRRSLPLLFSLILALAALVLPTGGAPAAVTHAASPHHPSLGGASSAYQHLGLVFEANRGQSDPRVLFLAHAPGSTIFLTRQGIVLSLVHSSAPARHTAGPAALVRAQKQTPQRQSVVQLLPLGTNRQVRVTASERQPGIVNYLIGRGKTFTRIPIFARITYHNLYPGIDLAIYGKEGGMEYDWVVHPGADPSRIAMQMRGASHLVLNRAGNVILGTSSGTVTESAPVLYQGTGRSRESVSGGFTLAHGVLRVRVGSYDRSRPLVIDPIFTFAYSTYLGGTDTDRGYSIAVDSSGSAYVTGYTASVIFPVCPAAASYCASSAPSPAQQNSGGGGNPDAFVTKLSADGSHFIYSTYLGGSDYESGDGIAVDSNGSAYVTGITYSTDFPVCPDNGGTHSYCSSHTGSPVQPSLGSVGTSDAFVTKLNADGTAFVYSTYLGGSDNDQAYGIAVDSSGSAYVTGYTYSTNFPVCPGAASSCASHTGSPAQPTYGGNVDAFITKVSVDGSHFVYSTYFGGITANVGDGIAVDSSGNAYVTGSTVQWIPGGQQTDAFVVKVSTDGSTFVYITYLGGFNYDIGNGIAVDASGSAYVVGTTRSSTDFPICPGANSQCSSHTGSPVQPTFGSDGTSDAFVTKLSPDGSRFIYSTYLGGAAYEDGNGIAIDTSGSAYVTGTTASSDFPVCPDNGGTHSYCASHTGSSAQSTLGGGIGDSDAFITELSADGGHFIYSTYLGGTQSDAGYGIAVDSSSNAYVTGTTNSSDFPVCPDNGGTHSYCSAHTGSPAQPGYRGSGDAFITKVGPAVTVPVAGTITLTGHTIYCTAGKPCTGTIATITDTDTDPCTHYTATVTSWGDGSAAPTPATVSGTTASGAGCAVHVTHTYLFPGTYTIKVSVSDSDGTSKTGQGTAVVSSYPTSTPGSSASAGTSFGACGTTSYSLTLGVSSTATGATSGTAGFTDATRHITITSFHPFSLQVSGNTAVVYGTATVNGVTGITVRFDITASSSLCSSTVEVRTSTGYDSGPFLVNTASVK